MAIDALVDVVLRFVGEVVLVGIFYWPGWIILRLLTAGRYPPAKGEPHSEELVAAFGVCGVVAGVLAVFAGAGI